MNLNLDSLIPVNFEAALEKTLLVPTSSLPIAFMPTFLDSPTLLSGVLNSSLPNLTDQPPSSTLLEVHQVEFNLLALFSLTSEAKNLIQFLFESLCTSLKGLAAKLPEKESQNVMLLETTLGFYVHCLDNGQGNEGLLSYIQLVWAYLKESGVECLWTDNILEMLRRVMKSQITLLKTWMQPCSIDLIGSTNQLLVHQININSPDIWMDDVSMCLDQVPDLDNYSKHVQNYLRGQTKVYAMLVMHPTVVQKSYNSEKRFLCPPPALYFTNQETEGLENEYSPVAYFKNPTGRVSDDEERYTRRLDSSSGVASIAIEDSRKISRLEALCNTPTTPGASKIAYFKHIFANSKRQDAFNLYIDIPELTYIKSGEIRVISKPSKKKQHIQSSGMTIANGANIALYNRIRAQTNSTRYLLMNPELTTDSMNWDTFKIRRLGTCVKKLCDMITKLPVKVENSCGVDFMWFMPSHVSHEAVWLACVPNSEDNSEIGYGDVVVLENTVTGAYTRPLIVRRLEGKNQVQRDDNEPEIDGEFAMQYLAFQQRIDSRDPVSPLHKLAFELLGMPGSFLGVYEDMDSLCAVQSHQGKREETMDDVGIWTITSTDMKMVRLSVPDNIQGKDDYVFELDKAPQIRRWVDLKDGRVGLIGENLSGPYRIFLGEEVLEIEEGNEDGVLMLRISPTTDPSGRELLFVREDGLIYTFLLEKIN